MSNEKNLTPEMLEQAKSAPSAEALLALAQENGITMTAEEAATYYSQFHPETGAISDEELDNVSGGGCNPPEKCKFCGHTEFVYTNISVGLVGGCCGWCCKHCNRPD